MRLLGPLLALLISLTGCATASGQAQRRIALSFDDVPRHAGAFFTPDERAAELIAALRRARVRQAGFFVTTGNLQGPHGVGGEARIAAYVRAGHVIANHSLSHLWLSRTPVEDYVADIDRAEEWLRGRPGYRPWFRFPFLDEGGRDAARRDAVRAALAERGLRNAYVTIDNYDWHLDSIASQARRDGKAMDMDALRHLYVETLVDTAGFYDRIAVETLGRSPAHVLLLHETDLAALFVDDLVAGFRAAGWEIIAIDEAYRDPIAASEPDTWFLGEGRVSALAHMRGRQPRSLVHPRTDEAVLSRLFEERVLRRASTP
ncbi:polysaccharide deacetylase family protein [Allosphingosinicella sp.]|jgi:peptidoglycan/xylan/chitin deacetylase (PgdA/CDA1 family)|uniref:polysaccharide deacetylase family protein n=1 Tax=Allosphingosinicella sp. TaxID=2823234 RepID=UPI002F13FF2E